MNPQDQLTAAAEEIGDSFKADESVRALIKQAIATNPTLVAMANELNCYHKLPTNSIRTMQRELTEAMEERDQLQTKCAELQERVRELEKIIK